jgi:hypothetical protein
MKKKETEIKDIRIQIRITKEDLEKIENYARKCKIERSTMVRNLLMSGLDNADFMNKVGIFDLVGFFRENKITPSDLLQLADDIV